MQRVDYEAIVRSAARRDAVVWIRREPGAFVIAGSALALVHPPAACDEDFATAVRRACVFGRDRTLWQDPESAAKQLVEVALRALSPGVHVDLVWAAGQRELTSSEDMTFVEARFNMAVEQFTRGPSSSRR